MAKLCKTGQQLFNDWSELCERHAGHTAIYSASVAYYFHKNRCQECTSPRVVAQNRHLTRELFGLPNDEQK